MNKIGVSSRVGGKRHVENRVENYKLVVCLDYREFKANLGT